MMWRRWLALVVVAAGACSEIIDVDRFRFDDSLDAATDHGDAGGAGKGRPEAGTTMNAGNDAGKSSRMDGGHVDAAPGNDAASDAMAETCPAAMDLDGDGGGNACDCASAPHVVSAVWVASACILTECEPGWTDCDGNPTNGCERDVVADGPCACQALMIDQTLVDADLIDFPVLVRLSANAELASRARSDGADIYFTDAVGNPIDHEIESYASATGALVAWVRVPSVSGTANTNIAMHYGDGTVRAENAGGTWEPGFGAVWHLQENPAAASSLQDSSGNAQHQIAGGVNTSYALTPTTDAASLIGNGVLFNANDEWVSFGGILSTGSALTVSAWWKTPATLAAENPIIANGSTTTSSWALGGGLTAGKFVGRVRNGAGTYGESPAGTVGTGNWHHLAMVYNGTGATNTDKLALYYDGGPLTETYSGTLPTSFNVGGSLRLGAYPWITGYRADGTLDEVHVSTTARSATWLRAEYENQKSGSTFLTVGPCIDNCPTDPGKLEPGICDCGMPDIDTDSDGFRDCIETCDSDPLKREPGACGCGAADADSDGDGSSDCVDACDYDASRTVGPCLAGYRKKITIAAGKVTATLTDFPVLVRLTQADLAAHAGMDGYDLVFKDGAGTVLTFEREYWNKSAGDLVAWVKLASVPSASATDFYLHYGDGTTVDRSSGTGVWSNGFKGVWHLGADYADSTGTTPTGTNSGSTTVTGLIGDADQFAQPDYIAVGTNALPNNVYETVTAWMNHSTVAGDANHSFFCNQQSASPYNGVCPSIQTSNEAVGDYVNTAYRYSTTDFVTNSAWTYVAVRYYKNSTSGLVESSVNGEPWQTVYSGDTSSTTNQTTSVLRIGAWAGGAMQDFEGTLDEIHFSSNATDAVGRRSNDWIKAEYDSQVWGSTFLTVGSEQVL